MSQLASSLLFGRLLCNINGITHSMHSTSHSWILIDRNKFLTLYSQCVEAHPGASSRIPIGRRWIRRGDFLSCSLTHPTRWVAASERKWIFGPNPCLFGLYVREQPRVRAGEFLRRVDFHLLDHNWRFVRGVQSGIIYATLAIHSLSNLSIWLALALPSGFWQSCGWLPVLVSPGTRALT